MPDQDGRQQEMTTMMLSLTVEDKIWLQTTAAERQTTVAALIRSWIAEKRGDENE